MSRLRNPDGTFMSAEDADRANADRQEREWMENEVKPRMDAGMTFHEALISAGGDVIAMPGADPDPKLDAEIRAAYSKAGREPPAVLLMGKQ